MLRFRQLQALHAVMDTGTVTGAAERLGVSQPAISNLLAQLEGQTNLRLFDRIKGRLTPTPEATVLFKEVDTVVRGLDQVSSAVTDLQNQRAGQLQIAATHAVSLTFLPKLIARFLADQPEVMVSLQTRYSRNIQEWVASQLYEIGVTELPIEQEGLDAEIFSVECRCAIPVDSPLAGLETATPQALDDAPFVTMGQDHMTYHRTREAFLQAGARWRPRAETHLFSVLLEFMKEGMGVGLVDPFTLAADDGAGYVTAPFSPSINLDLALIRARGRPLSRRGEAFYDALRATLSAQATHSETGAAAS